MNPGRLNPALDPQDNWWEFLYVKFSKMDEENELFSQLFHLVHEVDDELRAKVPEEHAEHSNEPATSLKKPALHSVHMDTPSELMVPVV